MYFTVKYNNVIVHAKTVSSIQHYTTADLDDIMFYMYKI